MSETTDLTHPSAPPPVITPADDDSVHPADVLINVIVTLLTPMFCIGANGNLALARMAATETIGGYRIRGLADVIAAGQIVAFGIAALGSLGLSMAEDNTVAKTLRLRGNANALSRSAKQNRRALIQPITAAAPPSTDAMPAAGDTAHDPAYEAAVLARVETTGQRVAAARGRRPYSSESAPTTQPAVTQTAAPPAPSAITAAAPPAGPLSPKDHQTLWAAAMSDVAKEYTDSIPGLPPPQRKLALRRAAILSSTADTLLCSHIAPQPLPDHLASLLQPPGL